VGHGASGTRINVMGGQCAENAQDPGAMPLYGPQLLTYLIENELQYARFLWRRMPKKLKESDHELKAIWAIGKNVWNKKCPEIYQSCQAFNWSPGTVLFVQAFAEKFRERTFKLISNSYSNISTQDLANLLGLGEQDAIIRTPTSALSSLFPFFFSKLSSAYLCCGCCVWKLRYNTDGRTMPLQNRWLPNRSFLWRGRALR